MKGRRRHLLAATAIALIAAMTYWWQVDLDPEIRGQRLSEYLKLCDGCGFTLGGSIQNDAISVPEIMEGSHLRVDFDVLSEVQPNSWPLLVRLLGGKEPRLAQALRSFSEKHKFFARFVKEPTTDAFAQQVGAVMAFRRLGRDGDPAVGRVVKLLDDPDSALAAIIALRHIQPENETYILQLTNVLSIPKMRRGSSPELVHSAAILMLGSFGPRASGATEILTNCLISTNERVRAAAAVALAKIGAPPEKIVPILVDRLAQTNSNPVSLFARSWPPINRDYQYLVMNIWALGEYGPQARPALPALSNLLRYPVVNAQDAARYAIGRINRETNDIRAVRK